MPPPREQREKRRRLAFVGRLCAGLLPPRGTARPARRDVRFRALAMTCSVVLLGGLAVEWWPALPSVGTLPADLTRQSMELFAREVIPAVRKACEGPK